MLRTAAAMITALRDQGIGELLAYAEPERVLVMWRSDPVLVDAIAEGVVGSLPFVGERVPDLFVPEHIVSVNHAEANDEPIAATVCASDYDREFEQALPRYARACEWVAGSDRRVTVARSLRLPEIDPIATFACMRPSGHARAFLRLGSRNYVGCSPELLAHGTRHAFTSFKLSGTASSSAAMIDDPRLVFEHQSSVASAIEPLALLGGVERGERQIVELPGLCHFETALHCIPRPGASVGECIDAVRPSGACPRDEGLALRAELEGKRGLYYGLVGYALPDGRFSFSQLIRTFFREGQSWTTRVGAAATAHSTAELELHETRLKLASMRFVLA
jgi:anthranilate/para-aminobenzoate synthase component I